MMISCKEAMELASKELDVRLSRKERLLLRFHVWFCQGCRRYELQLQWLHELCQRSSLESWLSDVTLSSRARDQIRQRLRRES